MLNYRHHHISAHLTLQEDAIIKHIRAGQKGKTYSKMKIEK